jgi:8-oxo-dGTP pyrophosphatase MutT (NUDIX family)
VREVLSRIASKYASTERWGDEGAGAVIVARDTGRLLVPRRSQEVMEPGTWGTWGGKLDEGEDVGTALIREIREESGYGGSFDLEFVYTYTEPDFQYHNFIAYVDEEFQPSLNWETMDYVWVDSVDDIPGPRHFGLDSVIPYIKSALGSDKTSSAQQLFYHASPIWNKDYILREGIRNDQSPVYDETVPGYVYLNANKFQAESWIENMFESAIPEFDEAVGVIFTIDASCLDQELIVQDPVMQHIKDSYAYAGNIPPSCILNYEIIDLEWDMDEDY